mgnify:CR=1 FL=1
MVNYFFSDRSMGPNESLEHQLIAHHRNNGPKEDNCCSFVMRNLISRIQCTIFVNPVSLIYARTVKSTKLLSSVAKDSRHRYNAVIQCETFLHFCLHVASFSFFSIYNAVKNFLIVQPATFEEKR